MFLRAFEHENIIYNCAVFDIPCLIDLAVLYGNGFPDIVSTIFQSVLHAGGKFANDTVPVICRATTVSWGTFHAFCISHSNSRPTHTFTDACFHVLKLLLFRILGLRTGRKERYGMAV